MHHLLANISLIVSNVLLGVSYSIIVGLLERRLSVGGLFAFEIIVGCVVLLPLALCNPRRRVVSLRDMLHIGLCAVITLYGWHYLILEGSGATTPLDIASLSTLSPTITILAAVVAKGAARPSIQIRASAIRAVVVPIVVLLIASLVVMDNTPTPTSRGELLSNGVIFVAVVAIGIATVIVHSLQQRYGTLTILAIYFAVALLLLPLFNSSVVRDLLAIDYRGSFGLLIYQSLFGILLPLYLLLWGAAHLTPLHTALYRYIQPIIAILVMGVASYRANESLLPSLRSVATTLLVTLAMMLAATLIMPRDSGVVDEK